MRIDSAIGLLGGKIDIEPIGSVVFLKNQVEDLEYLCDIIASWWSASEGWLGTAEEIIESIAEDFPDHYISVHLGTNTASCTIKGRRIEASCLQTFEESESQSEEWES